MLTKLLMIGVIAALIGLLVPFLRRGRHYGRLAPQLDDLQKAGLKGLEGLSAIPRPNFSPPLATFKNFLPPAAFSVIAASTEKLAAPERSYIPAHKKGGTVAYETIIANAPELGALYQSAEMRQFVSRIVGEPLLPTPIYDQSSLSVLVYEKPGDHIGWHFDHNFYRGRHFTVLLPVVNQGSGAGGLSHACLTAQMPDGDLDIATPPNSLVMFEGARVRHKVAPIIAGERRLVVSMTYCADPREAWWQGIARRVKDTAFFGLRALWT